MKILLVEDHQGSRRNLQRLIERRGHEVTACGSVEEAESALAHEKFPFLILDWMLPGRSGVDLCRELRNQPNGDDVYIWLITGRSDTKALEEALEAGANDYLIKPVDAGRLNVRLSVAERQIRGLAERNESRAALRDYARNMTGILENTTDGFLALDADWKFIYVNPKAATLLDCSRDELLGESFWKKFPKVFGSLFETDYRKKMAEGSALEFEATDATGNRWFEVHAYPSGQGISVFFRDVNRRKTTEEERLKTSKLESLGTLAAGIAHDLNNILTVISGNIGLAQFGAGDSGAVYLPSLAKAGKAAEYAAHLSNQLLTFAKGSIPYKQVTAVSELLAQACEFALHGSNLRAEINIATDLSRAEVDADQIKQVVSALILNARDAMPFGGTVRLEARNREIKGGDEAFLPPGHYLKVAVSDHGEGITPEVAAKMFDPYFTTKSLASGLGLSIAQSIVKKHGGLLHLESTSADGSTFAFYLPAIAAKAGRVEDAVRERRFNFDRQRVLVMDDDASIRDLTSQLLATLGYDVTTVPDGLAAIRTYERALRTGQKFQAVILDATVRGGLGGVATIERLRNVDPNVVAVICSGYSDEAALSEFLGYGFKAALPKPFTRTELGDVLQRAIATRKLG
jgi:two-component system cell cycle sensor histidine kinase/response regulator CckA